VLVGSETVIQDDPELTARTDPPAEKQPLRIIADSRARIPATAKVFATLGKGPVAIATQETSNLDHWPSDRGLQFWMLPKGKDGHISLPDMMDSAERAGIRSILVEGGGMLAASFVREGLVDRIEWFRAPILLGGEGRACLAALGLEKLVDAPTFVRTRVKEVGADLWESYVRRAGPEAGSSWAFG
jgi:diaminohydroxyphosphoribosylaminopyrimidine deaminase/5-amino-6-(5-phosphoribosylamino)uracil reductase